MQKNTLIFVFVLAALWPSVASAQLANLDSLKRKFSSYREAVLHEKLYIHTNQEFFLTGETMWLKVYAVDGTLHKPVNVSKVAYVELLDVNRKSVVQGKIKLEEAGGQGSLFIPASLLSGNYQLRGYTHWMKNFSPDYYFTKNITIVNPFITPERTTAAEQKYAIALFPEGGNLVSGIRSKVGFRISPAPAGEHYRGAVVSASGDTVARFSPHKFGIGNFYFTPSNQKYTCVVTDSRGNKSTAALPSVHESGYVMHVADSVDGMLHVRVASTGVDTDVVYLFVHARQQVILAEAKALSSRTIFKIDKARLPEGVSHFTVFTSSLTPVCERLYFVKPDSRLAIHGAVSQTSYPSRTKVSLSYSTTVGIKAAPSNTSVSVYRIDSLSKKPVSAILPYLVLTSDLQGDVESPEFYLSDDPDAAVAADNLMLTHGWRRFDWNKLLKKDYSLDYVPEYRGHIVQGKVVDANGAPVRNVLAYLSSPSKLVQLNAARSDARGEIHFEMNDFWGQRKLIAQLNNVMDSLLKITVTDPFSVSHGSSAIPPFLISKNTENDLKLRSVSMQVQDIYYRAQNERIINKPKTDSTSFYGKADKTYLLDDYTRFPLLEEVMREYVPDVFVRKRRDGFHFMMVNILWNKMFDNEPLVLLDGVPVFNLNKMMQFDPRLIKRLEVISRYFYLGPLRINGVVSYSTYQGDMQGFQLDPRAVVLDYEGLQLHREFYSPSYETGKQRNSRMPDQRTALFWQPVVMTDEKGSKTLEFYTSDVSGNYIAVIEGLTSDGHAGSGVVAFRVNNEEF